MEENLIRINLEMVNAINRLKQANGDAAAAYQKDIQKDKLEQGRANLKVKNLIRDYEARSKEKCTIVAGKVMEPADPRKMT